MKFLSGRELADFIKERQSHDVAALRSQNIHPTLLILRDNDDPVIAKYVHLKQRYGADIGIKVIDQKVPTTSAAIATLQQAATDQSIHAIILQLPLKDPAATDEILRHLPAAKDVDGLTPASPFDSATATAINWLLAGHNIDLTTKKIAIVGRGRLVGAPLIHIWQASGYDVTVFGHDADLSSALPAFDLIVTATGVPHLIQPAMLKPGVIIVDAGTASESGHLVGDVAESVRTSALPAWITPKIGGVGPLTISVLFENVITAAKKVV